MKPYFFSSVQNRKSISGRPGFFPGLYRRAVDACPGKNVRTTYGLGEEFCRREQVPKLKLRGLRCPVVLAELGTIGLLGGITFRGATAIVIHGERPGELTAETRLCDSFQLSRSALKRSVFQASSA